jgi:hypothetical protein
MNDLEEMRFGILEGPRLFATSETVSKLCTTPERFQRILYDFEGFFQQFDREHALDVYVFCLSEHDPLNTDGALSMWRAYGGLGNGAALVFNTEFVTVKDNAPTALTKVEYETRSNWLEWLSKKFDEWASAVAPMIEQVPDDKLYILAYHFFQLVKLFSLKFKHDGFKEEQEWRIVYLPDRDPQGILKGALGYAIGPRGVEPKLKLKIEPLPLEPRETWTFGSILDRIILGPSISSDLAKNSFGRMLEIMGKQEFKNKVVSSTIPLRLS